MDIRQKLTTNAAKYLQPGETVQFVMCAQTVTPYAPLISMWIMVVSKPYRVVVVTDRRILVCRSPRFRMAQIVGVVRELPRATYIGPASGLSYRCESLGQRLYINRRFFKDIEAADAVVRVPSA